MRYRLLVGGALAAVLVFAMLIELATTRSAGAPPIRLRAGVQFAAAAIVAAIALFGAPLPPVAFMALLAAAAVAPILVGLFDNEETSAV